MRTIKALLTFWLLAMISVGGTEKPKPDQAGSKPGKGDQVVAFYFHGNVRCETCLNIEKRAQEVLKQSFEPDITSKRLVFKPVNYDQPENAHFRSDFKLPCPSMVLVRQKDGKDRKWKLLNQTWDFVDFPPKFDKYVEEETAKFLVELE